MMRYPIIGLSGPARSGKDTAASFIIAATGGYRYAFADPLRLMLAAGLNINMQDGYWQERKEEGIPAFGGKSPRYLMQTLGTEWGRQLVDPDIWLNVARDILRRRGRGMVISDVRFNNEAEWIRAMGGTVIHLTRHAALPVNAHVSEAGVEVRPNVDHTIANDGSLEDLQLNVLAVVNGGRKET